MGKQVRVNVRVETVRRWLSAFCACGNWHWLDKEERWEFWPSGTLRRQVKRCGYCGDTLNADGSVTQPEKGSCR